MSVVPRRKPADTRDPWAEPRVATEGSPTVGRREPRPAGGLPDFLAIFVPVSSNVTITTVQEPTSAT